jgi:very-short-patch-repair endonuclease
MGLRADLFALSESQHGAVGAWQIAAIGGTSSFQKHLVASGEWRRVTRLVLVRTGAPPTRAQRLMTAVLDAGAGSVLSHCSAAAWWGLPGFDLRAVEVMRPRKDHGKRDRLATHHEPKLLRPQHVTVLDGIPVTTPSRTLFDLAGTLRFADRVERAVDNAWRRGLVSGRSLAVMLDELACRGRTGITLMRTLLADRGPGYRPPDSNLERRFEQLAREAGLELERQRDLGDDEWLGRVDFVHWPSTTVLEIDSERYHSALVDQRADAARQASLEAAGFTVIRFTDVQVWHESAEVLRRLRRIASRSSGRDPGRQNVPDVGQNNLGLANSQWDDPFWPTFEP